MTLRHMPGGCAAQGRPSMESLTVAASECRVLPEPQDGEQGHAAQAHDQPDSEHDAAGDLVPPMPAQGRRRPASG